MDPLPNPIGRLSEHEAEGCLKMWLNSTSEALSSDMHVFFFVIDDRHVRGLGGGRALLALSINIMLSMKRKKHNRSEEGQQEHEYSPARRELMTADKATPLKHWVCFKSVVFVVQKKLK